MTLSGLKEEILGTMFEAMKEAVCEGEKYTCATVNTTDGYIDLTLCLNGDVDAMVYHDDDELRDNTPLLKAFCENVLKGLSLAKAKNAAKEENAPAFEDEYMMYGEKMFRPDLQWHRL